MKRSIAALFLLSCLTGCVSSEMMATGGTTYPPRPKDYLIEVYGTTDAPVQVLQEIGPIKSPADLPYGAMQIGRIDSHGAPLASWGAVLESGKESARALGGDGLVLKSWASPLAAVDQYGGTMYAKELSMTVVRYQP